MQSLGNERLQFNGQETRVNHNLGPELQATKLDYCWFWNGDGCTANSLKLIYSCALELHVWIVKCAFVWNNQSRARTVMHRDARDQTVLFSFVVQLQIQQQQVSK